MNDSCIKIVEDSVAETTALLEQKWNYNNGVVIKEWAEVILRPTIEQFIRA